MEDCMKYWVELNDLMTDLHDAIEEGDVEAVEDIISTCRCALDDIEENLPYDEDEEDED